MKIVNYLDVTFDLSNGTYWPNRTPNKHPRYINIRSNHPPNIIKQIPASSNRRISDNSSNEEAFNKAKAVYNSALKASGYTETKTSNLHDLAVTDKEILSGRTLLSVKTSRLTSAEHFSIFSARIMSKLATAVWTT